MVREIRSFPRSLITLMIGVVSSMLTRNRIRRKLTSGLKIGSNSENNEKNEEKNEKLKRREKLGRRRRRRWTSVELIDSGRCRCLLRKELSGRDCSF